MLSRQSMVLALALMLFSSVAAHGQAYNESGGLVVFEMENTESPLGLWQVRNSPLTGFTGTGYLEFTGNKTTSGPPNSPLSFKFKINRAGLYYLHLHCARDTTHGQPADHSNDCYVRVDGDYGAGPNAGNNHGDDAPLGVLKDNTKFFGGAADKFAWASGNRLDLGGHNNKRVAVYDFKSDQEYTLVVHGRSQWFSVNRIVFRHTDTPVSVAQSLVAGGGGGGGTTPGGAGGTTPPTAGGGVILPVPTGPTSESYKVYQRLYGNTGTAGTGQNVSKSYAAAQKTGTGQNVSKSYEAFEKLYGTNAGQAGAGNATNKSHETYQRIYGNATLQSALDSAQNASESFKVFIKIWGHLVPANYNPGP